MARKTAEEAAKTRDAVIDAALRVFAEKGFAGAQLDDIASRAGVTRGAVYHHFTDKTDLLQVVLAERWPVATAPLLEPLERLKGRPAIEGFLVAYLEALEKDETLRALLVLSSSGELPATIAGDGRDQKQQVFARWLQLLDAQLKAAGASKSAPVRARSESILAGLLGYAVLTSLGHRGRSYAATRAELILSGALDGR
ncbi:MAG: TetR family transcriptional regulator [Myxococcales bacterium]|nr:TetR family transcriptional regulator [Myxococcales bacterium]